ncbi:MAG: hypothetical protein V3V67_00040 [Myxococcota bacterium]
MSKHRALASVGLSLVLICACATQPGDPQSPAEAVEQSHATAEVEQGQMICRTERPTGSHFSRRICRTAEQIQREREAVNKTLSDAREVPPVVNAGP